MKKIYRKAKEEDIIYIANLVTDLLGTCNLDLNKSIINNNIDEIQRQGIGRTLLNKCIDNINETILYEAWGDNGFYVNSKYLLEKCGFKFYKSLGNDYYKNHNYCTLCVNRNKNCTSCLAELYVKNINYGNI